MAGAVPGGGCSAATRRDSARAAPVPVARRPWPVAAGPARPPGHGPTGGCGASRRPMRWMRCRRMRRCRMRCCRMRCFRMRCFRMRCFRMRCCRMGCCRMRCFRMRCFRMRCCRMGCCRMGCCRMGCCRMRCCRMRRGRRHGLVGTRCRCRFLVRPGYFQAWRAVPAEDPQDGFQLPGDFVQDQAPGRRFAVRAAGSGQQDHGPQPGEFARRHLAQADVDLMVPGCELAQRADQAGVGVLVDLAGDGQDSWSARAGDPQHSVVVGRSADQLAPPARAVRLR